MKINQVEELVGISKKNIRFYETQGLIEPDRNPENGYREYTLKDVDQLMKVKLLRRLDVPIEQIRQLQEGKSSMRNVMEDHIVRMSHAQQDLERVKEICNHLAENEQEFEHLSPEKYLEEMHLLEEGGTLFMSIEKRDVKKEKRTPIIIAAIFIVYLLMVMGVLIWGFAMDQAAPKIFGLFMLAFLVIMAVCIGVVANQRIKEIEGGELDEARKY